MKKTKFRRRKNEHGQNLCRTNCKSKQSKSAFAKLECSLEKYYEEIALKAAEIMEYINGIEDVTVREIFMLRYFDGVRSWQKIAFEIGEYDESFVRKKHNAYLKKEGKI